MPPIEQIHPMLVHFPIVFVITLAALDVVLLARGREMAGRGGLADISAAVAVLAGLTAIAAYVFGDVALDVASSHGVPEARTELHETLGSISAAVLAIWALVRGWLWWRDRPAGGGVRGGIAVVELAMVALVLATAYAGGQLVFDYGVNVGRIAG